jgi:Pregnancy-associated plasma protein-A
MFVKRAIALAVGVLGLLAATAAPAVGAGHGHADDSGICFSGLDRLLTSAANARGGVVREKDTGDTPEEVPVDQQGQGGPTFAATVPVWFHVVSPDGVTGNVKDSVIGRQLQVLNATFAGTGFTYELAGVSRTMNADWYEVKDTADEQNMKKELRRGGADTLNVYLTSGAGFLGWAYFPSTYHSREYIDGVVLDYRSLPGGEYGREFSLGKTLTHEVGHWLGLYHTFQGGCNENGDYIDDTPAMRVPTSGCPAGKDTCPSKPGLDPIENYMDYSFDSCYTEFSPGQTARMQDQWLFFRAGQ